MRSTKSPNLELFSEMLSSIERNSNLKDALKQSRKQHFSG